MIRESSGRTRSLRALRCAALLLTVLLAPSCTGQNSSPPPLTADMPLHLEEHLDGATIVTLSGGGPGAFASRRTSGPTAGHPTSVG